MRRLFFVGMLILLWTVGSEAQPKRARQIYGDIPYGQARSSTTLIHWRSQTANVDSTIRQFTGSAVANDTSREVIWVANAANITLIDSFNVKQDSAMVAICVEFSPDKNMWFRYLPGTGLNGTQTIGSTNTACNAAVDSSGNIQVTSNSTAAVRYVKISSPPVSNWMRVLATKRLSASTDTMELKTVVQVDHGANPTQ